jgi:predicted nucleic acid-binding protein
MPLLLDTGAIYALADEDDAWHARMRDFLQSQRAPLLIPVTVIPEAANLLRNRLGHVAEHRFAESLAASELSVENLTSADVRRCAELMGTYDFLGYVDASVVAIAERLKLKSLMTTDRRDFGRVRPRHTRAFELLPLL